MQRSVSIINTSNELVLNYLLQAHLMKQFITITILLAAIIRLQSQAIHIPDPSFLNALIEEGVDDNADGSVSYAEAESIRDLNIAACKELKWLECDKNKLSNLDISACKVLDHLICDNNKLSSLNVSGCFELLDLQAEANLLTLLDVSSNTALEKLICSKNNLLHSTYQRTRH